jgi:hypothetical protein
MLPYDINMIRIVLPLFPGKRIGNCKALRRNGCVIRLDDGGSGRSSCLELVKLRLANLQEIDAGLHLTGTFRLLPQKPFNNYIALKLNWFFII